ncbi:MAG TPA: MlaD family protein [Candidatus Kapabacteria bacterium]|nr:MlaD family protein [Candidatus Kapabacteria bacterium]
MKKSKGAFIIGLFVLIGTAVLVALIFWLSAHQFMKEQRFFVTYFNTSVEGLERGSAVKYQGVLCGRVTDIKVAPDSLMIEVIMQIDPNVKIYDNLRVRLTMAGITGGSFLQLHFPNSDMVDKYPKIQGFEPPFPVIKSAPSGLDEITFAAQRVMNNMLDLDVNHLSQSSIDFLKSGKTMLDNTNKVLTNKEIVEIINNLNNSTLTLLELVSKMNNSEVLDNANQTSQNLVLVSQKLQYMVDSLTNQIVQLKLPTYIDKAYLKYDSLMSKTNNSISNVAYRSEASLMTVQETLEQIKITNRYLQKTLRTLSDNPSSIFLTEPQKKEK